MDGSVQLSAMTTPWPLRNTAEDRANVGKATVDRNLPDPDALTAPVLDEAFDVPEARASDLADQPGDPVDLIEDMASFQEQAALADTLLFEGLTARARAHA